jgi:hypothetical protein
VRVDGWSRGALSVIVRANNGQQRRLRFPWVLPCEVEGAQWTLQPDDTVGRLKALIADRVGIPPHAQQVNAEIIAIYIQK